MATPKQRRSPLAKAREEAEGEPITPEAVKPIRRPKVLGIERDFAKETRARLGIPDDALRGHPLITPLLMRATTGGRAQDGIAACLEALRCDSDPESMMFMEKYDSLSPTDIDKLRIEEIAIWAGLTPRRLAELITGAMLQFGQFAEALIVASSRHLVTEKTVERALTDFGERDREMFHKHSGWLPLPKGMSVNVNTQNNTLNTGSSTEDQSLPAITPGSADAFFLDLQSTVTEQKQLTAPMVVEAEPLVDATVPALIAVNDDVLLAEFEETEA